jgi:hypothetical protein
VFSCDGVEPVPGFSINQFGQPVLLPPVPGDSTGQSVNVDQWCSNLGATNPGWTAKCVTDPVTNAGNAVMFTYTGQVSQGTVYP